MKMINTSICEHCQHGKVDDSNKSRVTVYCEIKKKTYMYGQCVPCEDTER